MRGACAMTTPLSKQTVAVKSEEPRFVIVYQAVREKITNPFQLAVYCAIKWHANNQTNEAHLKFETIAREAYCSVRQAQRAVKELAESGLISVGKAGRRGQNQHNVYTVLFPAQTKGKHTSDGQTVRHVVDCVA